MKKTISILSFIGSLAIAEATPLVDFGSVYVETGFIHANPTLSPASTGDYNFDGSANDTARSVEFGTVWGPTTKGNWLQPYGKSGRNLRYGKVIANLDSATDPVGGFKYDRVVSFTQPNTVQISNDNGATSTNRISMASAFYFKKQDFLNGLATLETIRAGEIGQIKVNFTMRMVEAEGRVLLRNGEDWYVSKSVHLGGAAHELAVNPSASVFYPFNPDAKLLFNSDSPGSEVDGSTFANITAIGVHMQHRDFDGTSDDLRYQSFNRIEADYLPEWDLSRKVDAVHAASTARRLAVLREAVGRNDLWPRNEWGGVMWALSLLYLNERVADANERIRSLAGLAETDPAREPFAYFGTVDYVRILALFNSRSSHFPGRLEPSTETLMKDLLWQWAKPWEEYWEIRREESSEPEGSVWSVYASENHDLIRKGNNYIIFSILAEDPAYRDVTTANGRTVAEYVELYNTYFKKWFRARAASGMWMELGSEYAKYTYSIFINLYDLAPDPEVRQLAKMFLDLSLIDEEQNSFRDGFRAGGKARVIFGPGEGTNHTTPGFTSHKELLFGEGGSASHSKVYEVSQYQVPAAAVYLRFFGDHEAPYTVRNRLVAETFKKEETVPGNVKGAGATFYMAEDSAFLNYAYKTPHYSLGSRLDLIDGGDDGIGDDSGNTRQDRWGWLVFNDEKKSRVMPLAEKTDGGSTRARYAYWQVQHENLMIAQRTGRAAVMNRLMVYMTPTLLRDETGGWVFGGNEDAWVAVKVIGGYNWGPANNTQWPGYSFILPNQLYAPIVFLTGSEYEGFTTFERFKDYVLNRLTVEEQSDRIVVQRPDKPQVQFYKDYRAPVINDSDPNNPYNAVPPLRTAYVYNSPYMKTGGERSLIWVRWGGTRWLYDFNSAKIHENVSL